VKRTLNEASRFLFVDRSVNHSTYPALCVLIADDDGWLMCLRYDGDAGFSSRNPDYRGDAEESLEFELGNGQVDEYPAAWCYPRARVLAAVLHFAETGRVPADISWDNDSGDGRGSPNDALEIDADDE
jgi:hypothetical protein